MKEWELDWTTIHDSVSRVVEAQREYKHSLKELEELNAIAPKATIDYLVEGRLNDLSRQVVDIRLMVHNLATAIAKQECRANRIDVLEREIKALSYALGIMLKDSDSITGGTARDRQGDKVNREPAGQKEAIAPNSSECGRLPLSPVKQQIVNHISAKKESFYPSQIARELGLCVTYVSKVLQQLEDGRWLKSVDNKGYRGRKLYQVTIPVAIPLCSK
ncbi:MAG TPA: hypothetical protein DDW76_33515 [Cyanobacteria bacterium UBA11369]|nr:hypothetical protein [Cyanobacteria bacterium UBA8543]HBE53540.1 hypothetical protein [Cyanobacteria bacterium UBA11369]